MLNSGARRRRAAVVGCAIALLSWTTGCGSSDSNSNTTAAGDTSSSTDSGGNSAAAQLVTQASAPQTKWLGPSAPVPAAKGKTLGVVSCSLALQGCQRLAHGGVQAAKALGWKVIQVDGKSTSQDTQAAIDSLFARKVDALLVAGIASASIGQQLQEAKKLGIPAFSNFATDPTPYGGLGVINQDNYRVGQLEGAYVVSKGCGDIITFTSKENAQIDERVKGFTDYVGKNGGGKCKIAATQSVPLSDVGDKEQPIISALLQKYPNTKWLMAGFDAELRPMLVAAASLGKSDIQGVGSDGDLESFDLIRKGQGQVATVGVSLEQSGWAAVDQLNRALQKKPLQEQGVNLRLFTKDNVPSGKQPYDGDYDYRAKYQQLWGVE